MDMLVPQKVRGNIWQAAPLSYVASLVCPSLFFPASDSNSSSSLQAAGALATAPHDIPYILRCVIHTSISMVHIQICGLILRRVISTNSLVPCPLSTPCYFETPCPKVWHIKDQVSVSRYVRDIRWWYYVATSKIRHVFCMQDKILYINIKKRDIRLCNSVKRITHFEW